MTYNPYVEVPEDDELPEDYSYYADRDDDDIEDDEQEDEQQAAAYPSPVERVQAGVIWLKLVEPDWLNRIDLETLNILSGTECVAGQLGGDYFQFFDRYGFITASTRCPFAKLHGFLGLGDDEGNADFHDDKQLTEAWRQAISALRG